MLYVLWFLDIFYCRIISSHLPPYCKRPFLRYLIYAYMNTSGDQINAQGVALSHGE